MLDVAITCSLVANGGDAAILMGTLRVLREAFGEVDATVYDLLPDVARRHYPELDIRAAPSLHAPMEPNGAKRFGRLRTPVRNALRTATWNTAIGLHKRGAERWAQALVGPDASAVIDAYATHDLTVASGGTYLVENYSMTPRFVDLGLGPQLDVPQALLTQSLGPFTKPSTQKGVRRIIQQSGLTLLRDERSRRHLDTIGAANATVHVGADTAFALADPAVLVSAQARRWPDSARPRIGISVRDWAHFANQSAEDGMAQYGAAIQGLVEHLVRAHHADVVFVSTCQGNPEYGKDDSVLAASWRDALPNDVQDSVSVISAYHRPVDLMTVLAELDLMVSTRMHAMILALCAGTPVLPISYEFKTDELFLGLGLPHWVADIDVLTTDELVTRAEAVIDELPAARTELFERVERMRHSALHDAASLLQQAFPEFVDRG